MFKNAKADAKKQMQDSYDKLQAIPKDQKTPEDYDKLVLVYRISL